MEEVNYDERNDFDATTLNARTASDDVPVPSLSFFYQNISDDDGKNRSNSDLSSNNSTPNSKLKKKKSPRSTQRKVSFSLDIFTNEHIHEDAVDALNRAESGLSLPPLDNSPPDSPPLDNRITNSNSSYGFVRPPMISIGRQQSPKVSKYSIEMEYPNHPRAISLGSASTSTKYRSQQFSKSPRNAISTPRAGAPVTSHRFNKIQSTFSYQSLLTDTSSIAPSKTRYSSHLQSNRSIEKLVHPVERHAKNIMPSNNMLQSIPSKKFVNEFDYVIVFPISEKEEKGQSPDAKYMMHAMLLAGLELFPYKSATGEELFVLIRCPVSDFVSIFCLLVALI